MNTPAALAMILENEDMAENTKIEWADHTFNPWMGCTKVGPGCDNCYAEALMDTRYGRVEWGAGKPRVRTSPSNWAKPRKWNRDTPGAFVFCSSLADVFDNEVSPVWRADLFDLIAATPNLTWLLLTKRIGNVGRMMDGIGLDRLPSNVGLGATMVNQAEYDRDRIKLAAAGANGAAFTFGSFEPLVGPIVLDSSAPDWIIVGGESGPNARPMNLDWARSLRRQSAELGRVFNFKQVGGRTADKGGHLLDGKEYLARPNVERIAA